MTTHLIKLSVGSLSVESLGEWQLARIARMKAAGEDSRPYHRTRMSPRRRDEVLDGGSIYWVIKRVVQCRQRIVDLRMVQCDDGIERCDIVMEPELILVHGVPRRPFQGWRYLKPEDAPRDLVAGDINPAEIPVGMRQKLMELGLI